MADWNIRPRSTTCTTCGVSFSVGDKGHSLLHLEGDQWVRQDYCVACFKAYKASSPKTFANAWTFVVSPSQKRKAAVEVVKRETAEHLLRTLVQRQQPEDAGMIYILAVLLERNKQFVERRTALDDEGRRVRVYEQRATGDIFTILDPGLQPADVPALQKRIVALLEGKVSLEEDASEPSPTSETTTEAPSADDTLQAADGAEVDVAEGPDEAVDVTPPALPLDLSMERLHDEELPFDTTEDKDLV